MLRSWEGSAYHAQVSLVDPDRRTDENSVSSFRVRNMKRPTADQLAAIADDTAVLEQPNSPPRPRRAFCRPVVWVLGA
jgi:hypothetical protein